MLGNLSVRVAAMNLLRGMFRNPGEDRAAYGARLGILGPGTGFGPERSDSGGAKI